MVISMQRINIQNHALRKCCMLQMDKSYHSIITGIRGKIINRGGGDLKSHFIIHTEDFADVRNHKPGTFTPATIDGKKVTVPDGGKVVFETRSVNFIGTRSVSPVAGVPGTGDVILFECQQQMMIQLITVSIWRENSDNGRNEPAKYPMFADYPKYTKYKFITKDNK